MSRFARYSVAILAFATAASTALTAEASPWTVPKDKLLLSLNYDFAFAENEFLPDGDYQSFPLNGRFTSSTLRLGGRYGFTSRLEIAAELNVKTVTFTADPFIPRTADNPDPDPIEVEDATGAIIDFSNTLIGPADLFFTVRYNFLRGVFAFANEARVKLPTGYEPPSGTFDADGNVDDDLSLGDGQTDIEDSLLLGVFIPPTRTFARLDLGFRLRFGGPGHQAIGAFRAGQFIGEHIVLFAGTSGAYTVVEGDPIGKTFVATVDDLQPEDVIIGDNTVGVDLRVDKDFLQVEGGILLVPRDGLEIQASYSQIVVGANIAAIQSVSLGTAIHFDNLTAEDEDE